MLNFGSARTDQLRPLYCDACVMPCHGVAWRVRQRFVKASFDEEDGEHPAYGAIHECGKTVCRTCVASKMHCCGDGNELLESDGSDY